MLINLSASFFVEVNRIKKLTQIILGMVVPPLVSLSFLLLMILIIINTITSASIDDPCENGGTITDVGSLPEDTGGVPSSVDEFVKQHKDAYILAWKAGGFLPSASIAQTMVENGFNFTNPSGTSFWQAHNMGGGATRFSISVQA